MPLIMQNVTHKQAWPVLGASVLNLAAAWVLFSDSSLFGAVIALILGISTYLFVYRMLADDARVARSCVGTMAAFDVFYIIALYTSHQHGIVFALEIAAAACLGFAYTQFKVEAPQR
jgi:O-antigen/teichoic acid export membrane protein